jgi:DNA-binding MarR family transcriptional regulator
MNKTVDLVCSWAEYEELHPEGTLEDFYRYSLISLREKKAGNKLVGGVVPPSIDPFLIKLIGRLYNLLEIYLESAVNDAGLNQIEEFVLMSNISFGNPRKTEVIHNSLIELSTGTNILNKLKAEGCLDEYDDLEDKRAKRVKLTAKGEKLMIDCRKKMAQIAVLFFEDMTEDDKYLCVQLLKNVEIKFSGLWQRHKGKPFEEIYQDLLRESNEHK